MERLSLDRIYYSLPRVCLHQTKDSHYAYTYFFTYITNKKKKVYKVFFSLNAAVLVYTYITNIFLLHVSSQEDFRNYEWDYRWMDYPPQEKGVKHPRDLSVATYRGHSVLRTLIRCYFSPEYR